MKSRMSMIAGAVGLVYVLVGLAGFLVPTDHSNGEHSTHILWFQVNPLHNIAHLGLGLLLVAGASRGAVAARQMMLAVGLVYLLLGLVGPLIMNTSANVVAVNSADHILHILTAIVLIAAALASGRRLQLTPT